MQPLGAFSGMRQQGINGLRSYADLVEAAEQTVRRYEELELGLDLTAAGA
jgi:hypothetical protein